MTRTHGRCRRGDRLVMPVPAGHRKATALVAALRADGTAAPTVADGATDRAASEAYVAQQLVPALRPGDVVVTDDLPAHTGPRVRAPVAAAGAEARYLPPYRPDRNRIEKAWGKRKARLRAAAERTVEALWARIGRWLEEFRPEECRDYFKSCGYPAATPDREPL